MKNKSQKTEDQNLKTAILKGEISHKDLEGIIKRFQTFE
jgi:hypothetical protein